MNKLLSILVIAIMMGMAIDGICQSEKTTQKKIIIIEEVIDADGNKTTKKTVKVNDDISDEDLEKWMSKADGKRIKKRIEVRGDDHSEKEVKVIVIDGEGNSLEGDNIWITEENEMIELGDGHKYKVIILDEEGHPLHIEDMDVEVMSDDTGEEINIRAKINNKHVESDHKPKLGVMIENADNGVAVLEVMENTPAARAGLKVSDIITKVDAAEVMTIEELLASLKAKEYGDEVTITYLRDGKKSTTKATLAKVKYQDKMIFKDVEEVIEKD